MKEKSKMIISYLNSSDDYTPSSSLAQYLNVSERSIKRYIKSINKELEVYGAKIDSAKGLGYKLLIFSNEEFKAYIKTISQTNKENSVITSDLIRSILKEYPISLDDLSEILYTSRSTLQNEITNIKELLNNFDINLKYKPYKGLYLEGTEENIRRCCIKYFFEDEGSNEITLSIDLKPINDGFIYVIKNFIEKELLSREIFKNDYEINYLTKMITVSCYRSINGYNPDKIYSDKIETDVSVFNENLKIKIKDKFDIEIKDTELNYMNELIEAGKSSTQNLSENEVRKIVENVLKDIDMKYKISLYEDESLLINLTKHILNSYHRYYLKIDVENFILDQVKMNYPEAFNYALDLGSILEKILKTKINSNEIGYIAIHFATAIERAKQKISYKSIIVCNTGIGTSELIKTKLRRYFPEIEVVGCYQLHYLQKLDLVGIDFIISTINIDKDKLKNKNLIYVSHVLDDIDIQNIEDELNKIYLQSYLKSLFNNNFYYKLQVKDKLELIELICNDMVKNDYITKVDKDSILKREALSSTEISNLVAVPHCISSENKNTIAICTLKDAIKWGSASVKLVFIACLNSEIKENKHVFPFVHSSTKKSDIVNRLCECTSLNEFIEILMRSNTYDS
ncbi:BglG family transcription antiterminator [Paraclostridium bifermentans]|uniref:BglG family transcription antiterminator n=1 Tax=Paraclostridium bifermentans TaxID=1490 RepID=UPI0029159AD4|nr:BglG family transcription antiterminator [Paraclostridium bifermentans]MDU3336521.1 BglG family transcription antiterminator [Paraclostridium bifermentans]